MAGARKTAKLGFEALRIEGGLIAPDMVAEIAGLRAHGQSEVDYAVPPGLRLRDEIARFWRIGGALWARFDQARKSPSAQAGSENFVRDLLTQVFGFSDFAQATDGSWVTFEALDGRIPIAVAPAVDGLDKGLARFADAGRRRSAMLAAQERLNADDRALWGIASDGLTLRLLRDNASLTRPAYIEADLARIFGAGLYSDFFALWLLIHQSRFGKEDVPASESPLERWREAGREAGARARERIRGGVEAALTALGAGFIAHPTNETLRAALAEGRLTPPALFEELLRLVYRLIFLFTTEDRGLLHAPAASAASKRLYADGYSLARLRALAARRAARDSHHDLFEGLKILFRAVWTGERALGLPALGGLFRADQLENLGGARVANRDLLEAVFRLAWIVEDRALMRVNWRDMETEELGSVYEALLELTPQIDVENRTFAFGEGREADGNERKTSGSYYTPDNLVGLLLDSALEPVIERAVAENPGSEEKALLELTVVDPACGSGHFLLAAGRRIATRLAQIRAPGSPTVDDWRRAVREVTRSCLFGVDRNPMAVELCRTALWIESVEPGKPLTFLDAHIQCGDSLIGVFDLAAVHAGVPDAAYKPLKVDDKEIAAALRRRNREERSRPRERGLFSATPTAIAAGAQDVERLTEDDVDQVESKRRAFEALRNGAAAWNARVACDLYVAAFFQPKVRRDGALVRANAAVETPTTSDVLAALEGRPPQGPITARAIDTAAETNAFHWPLAFPQVFARGGFDVVIGNPPWELVESKTERESLAREEGFKNWTQISEFSSLEGRRDLYKMFLVRALGLLSPGSTLSFLLPIGFLLEEDALALRQYIWRLGQISQVFHLQNRSKQFFPHVHASYRFLIATFERAKRSYHEVSVVLGAEEVKGRQFGLKRLVGQALIGFIESGCYTELHASVAARDLHDSLAAAVPRFVGASFDLRAEWHATSDKSFKIQKAEQARPVGKNRNIHLLCDHFSDPDFWVTAQDAAERAIEKKIYLPESGERIILRDIARNDDSRTILACLTANLLSSYDTPMVSLRVAPDYILMTNSETIFMAGYLSSVISDYLIRPYVDKHIKGYVIRRVPVPLIDTCNSRFSDVVEAVAAVTSAADHLLPGQPVWTIERGARALGQLESAVGSYLNIPPAMHLSVLDDFPGMSKDQVIRFGTDFVRAAVAMSRSG